MPYREGSLADILDIRKQFDELTTSRIIFAIAEGIEYAWTKYRILHLDLKPSNVLVKSSETLQVNIADWGISRLAKDHRKTSEFRRSGYQNELTSYGAGTPLYMAPERFSGYFSLSPVIDIFSLGLMAIQLHTGILPFHTDRMDPKVEIVTGRYYENAKKMLSDSGDIFQSFCLECIHPDSSKRTNSYRDILAKLSVIARKGK